MAIKIDVICIGVLISMFSVIETQHLDWLNNPCDGQATDVKINKQEEIELFNEMYKETSSLKNSMYLLDKKTGDRIQSPFLRMISRNRSHDLLNNKIFPHILDWDVMIKEKRVSESIIDTYTNLVKFVTFINHIKEEETTYDNNAAIIQLLDTILTKTKALMCGNVVLLNYFDVPVPPTEFSIPENMRKNEVKSSRWTLQYQISYKSLQYLKSLKKFFLHLKTIIKL